MAVVEVTLKADIITVFNSVMGAPDDATKLATFAEALAKVIVTKVIPNMTVAVTGVTTGGGSAGGTVS